MRVPGPLQAIAQRGDYLPIMANLANAVEPGPWPGAIGKGLFWDW
jgi:hypothetical protein